MTERPRTERRRRAVADLWPTLLGLLAGAIAVACVVVVVVNQQSVGWPNLLAMLAGLAGLIVLLALYNRRYR